MSRHVSSAPGLHSLPRSPVSSRVCYSKVTGKRNFYILVKLVLISDTYCILMIAIPLLLPHEKGTN